MTSPGNWNGFSFGSSSLPTSAPGALGTSSLPVYTGQSYSLSQLTTAFPNTDTSTTDGYAGLYVLRLRTYQHPTTSTSYDVADISVNSNTGAWTLVYSPGDHHHDARDADSGQPAALRHVGHVDRERHRRQRAGDRPIRERRRSRWERAAGHQRDGHAHDHRVAGRHRLPHRGVHAHDRCGVRRIHQHTRLVHDQHAHRPRGSDRSHRHPGQCLGQRQLQRAASNGGSTITGYTVTATDHTTPANGGRRPRARPARSP